MIFAFGKTCLDYLCTTSKYPVENSVCHITSYTKKIGGMAVNALRTAARFGAETVLVSYVDTDEESDRLVNELKREGINTRYLIRESGAGSFSFIIINGVKRTIFHYPASAKYKSWLPQKMLFSEGDIVLVDCTILNGLMEILEQAHGNKAITVMDVSSGNRNERIKDILPLIDIGVVSLGWAQCFTGVNIIDDISARLRSFGLETFILTDGGKEIFIHSPEFQVSLEPPKVEVIDTNGAGDVFHGAFCWALSNTMSLYEAAAFSLITATYKCGGIGIPESIPPLEKILKKMRTYLNGER